MSDFDESGLDSLATWFKTNSKVVLGVAAVAAAAAIGVVIWQKSAQTKLENAERAYFQAQTAGAQNPTAGTAEMAKIATRYAGTSAGDRAALLVIQGLLTQGKADSALVKLQALASGGGTQRLGSTLQTLMAAAYEGLNKPADAAKAYLAAADASVGDAKLQRQADAARAFQAAGNGAEALKIWTELAADANGPMSAEAHVRIGELAVRK